MEMCIECGKSVAVGSGLYVNRIPADNGWICSECSMCECTYCNQHIPLDEDVSDAEGNKYHENCFGK